MPSAADPSLTDGGPRPPSTPRPPLDAATIRAEASAWIARRDAGLDAASEAALAAWLAADPRHHDAFAHFAAAWDRLDRPYSSGALSAWDAAWHRAEQRRRTRHRRRLLSAAAALLVLLGLASLLWPPYPHHDPFAVTTAQTQLLLPRQQTLPDGSRVTLKGDAAIAVHYTPQERRIALTEGEAWFEVRADATRPFVVVADATAVRAVGTAFLVHKRPASVAILVTEGRVSVEDTPPVLAGISAAPSAGLSTGRSATPAAAPSPPSPSPAPPAPAAARPPALLEAGHELIVATAAAPDASPHGTALLLRPLTPTRIADAAIEERLAWRVPRVEFAGTRLDEAVDLFNHHHASAGTPPLVLADPALGARRITGLFRLDRGDAFLALLDHGFGIVADRRDPACIRLRARAEQP